jgi:hypothetical protein
MTYTGQLVTGIAVLLAYLIIMLFAATNYIRRANRGWLEAHEAAFLGRVRAGVGEARFEASRSTQRWNLLPRRASNRLPGGIFSPSQWIALRIARWVRLHERSGWRSSC